MTRPCTRCGRDTPPEDFAKAGTNKRRSWCRACECRRAKAKYYRLWSAKRELRNEQARQRYHANKPAAESG